MGLLWTSDPPLSEMHQATHMKLPSLASLTAREALALGVSFEDWLNAQTRSDRRAVAEAEQALRDAEWECRSQWTSALKPEGE